MFGEDGFDYDDQDDPPGKGTKAVVAGGAVITSPDTGALIWEGIKDIGSGLFQTAKFGVSATAGAVFGTVALVLLPTEAGRGSDRPPRGILPPPLIPPDLLKKNQDQANFKTTETSKKQNRRADAEHTSTQSERTRNKHENGRARKDREQAKADEKYNDTKSTKKDTQSNNQKKKDDPNYTRTGPKTQ